MGGGSNVPLGFVSLTENLMMIAMLGQIALGIVTVINAAPVHIAIFHQVLAVVLGVLILRARFLSAYPIPTSVRGKS